MLYPLSYTGIIGAMTGPAYKTAAELHNLLLRLIAEAGTTPAAICAMVGGHIGARLARQFDGQPGLYTSLDIATILEVIHVPTTAVFGDWPELDAAHTRVIRAAREHVLTLTGVRRERGPRPLPLAETTAELHAAVEHLNQVEIATG